VGLGWGWGRVVATVYLLSFRVRKVSWSHAGEVCGDRGGVAVVVGVWLRGGLVVFVVLGWFFGVFFWGECFHGWRR